MDTPCNAHTTCLALHTESEGISSKLLLSKLQVNEFLYVGYVRKITHKHPACKCFIIKVAKIVLVCAYYSMYEASHNMISVESYRDNVKTVTEQDVDGTE